MPQSRRGPGITPAAIASRTATSRKCSSVITRSVVVPEARSRRRLAVARRAWGTASWRSWPIWSPSPGTIEMWLCASTRPGITKRSLQSSTAAPAGTGVVAAGPTAVIRAPSSTTTAARTGGAPVPSKSVPQRIARSGAIGPPGYPPARAP